MITLVLGTEMYILLLEIKKLHFRLRVNVALINITMGGGLTLPKGLQQIIYFLLVFLRFINFRTAWPIFIMIMSIRKSVPDKQLVKSNTLTLTCKINREILYWET